MTHCRATSGGTRSTLPAARGGASSRPSRQGVCLGSATAASCDAQLRSVVLTLAVRIDSRSRAGHNAFSTQQLAKLHSTNPLERFSGEIKCRGQRHLTQRGRQHRLVGTILLEQKDEWAAQRTLYITLASIGSVSDEPVVSLPAVAAWPSRPKPASRSPLKLHQHQGRDLVASDGLQWASVTPRAWAVVDQLRKTTLVPSHQRFHLI